eukprot:8234532-Heterocapsa_arctica.AAC.1
MDTEFDSNSSTSWTSTFGSGQRPARHAPTQVRPSRWQPPACCHQEGCCGSVVPVALALHVHTVSPDGINL